MVVVAVVVVVYCIEYIILLCSMLK